MVKVKIILHVDFRTIKIGERNLQETNIIGNIM